jgi:putative transposase
VRASLDRFAAALAKGAHAALALDRAGWHGARSPAVPPDIPPVPLPPYAPEPDPVGRVWLLLRERFSSHRLLDGHDAIVEACCDAWNAPTPDRLRTLAAFPRIAEVAS